MNRALAHYETRSRRQGSPPREAHGSPCWVQADLAVQVIAQTTPKEAIRPFAAYPGQRVRSGVVFDVSA